MPWNIQCFEVVVIVFDLRAFRDAIANMAEELLDPLQRAGHWMQSAGRLTAPRQGYVDPLGCQLRSQGSLLKVGLASIEHILH